MNINIVKKNFTFFYFIFLSLLLSASFFSVLASPGDVFIRNFLPEEYKANPQIWSIVQDKRGVMYFGSSGAVLEFDGVNWNKILVPNNAIVRSLAVDDKGVIYVGTQSDFGFLEPDLKGNVAFRSLTELIQPQHRKFADVWQCFTKDGGIFFRTSNKLFFYKNNKIKTWEPENSFFKAFVVNDNLYLLDRDRGLKFLFQDSLYFIPGGEFFSNDRVYAILPYETNDKILVSTENRGFFLVNAVNDRTYQKPNSIQKSNDFLINSSTEKEILPFSTETDQYLSFHKVYTSMVIPSNQRGMTKMRYAFGTTSGGIIIINSNGDLLKIIDKDSGIEDNMVLSLFSDRQGAVWVGLNKGIARIEINSPFSIIAENYGIIGNIETIYRFEGKLFAGTIQGLFYFDEREPSNHHNRKLFKPISEIFSSCWDLQTFISNTKENSLLIATSDGLYQYKENSILKIKGGYVFSICPSTINMNRIFLGGQGLSSVVFESGKWVDEGHMEGTAEEIRSIKEDNQGNLWLGTSYKGLIRVDFFPFNSIHSGKTPSSGDFNTARWGEKYLAEKFNEHHGIPTGPVWVLNMNNKIVFSTSKGIYSFNNDHSENKYFLPDSTLGGFFAGGGRPSYPIATDNSGNIWLKSVDILAKGTISNTKNNVLGKYDWEISPFLRLPGDVVNKIKAIYPDKNGIVWFGGHDGLFRFDESVVKDYKVNFPALIRKVTTGKDSVLFRGTYYDYLENTRISGFEQSNNLKPQLSYNFNSLTIEFSAPSFDNEKETDFQYILDGFDQTWSDWSNKTTKEYTNLPEKEYVFHVRARDVYGHISRESVYQFTILTPWFRSFTAYVLYMLILALLIYAVVVMNSKRLREENIRLEQIIAERTAEIVEEKEKVKKQNFVIESKNKDILDSIKYAKRIQEAILPKADDIYRILNNSFLLYKPKDIVSGDFYWFSEFEKYEKKQCIIAACDCTGHGVPGAFMSLIGNELLNQIVIEKNITQPGEVLNQLHTGVRFALRQYKEDAEVRDGMDIALCKIDQKEGILDFAGAHRPLYIYSKGKIEDVQTESTFSEKIDLPNGISFREIRADKFPIGGLQLEEQRKFSNNKIKMLPGDTVYIFSDGFIDQFGGPKNKKYMTRRFKTKLGEIQHLSMRDQEKELLMEIKNWSGETDQTDDIIIIGVRF